jgi:hypothetical protein
MASIKSILKTLPDNWSIKKRYKVGDTVRYSFRTWQNVTGSNTEPGETDDWYSIAKEVVGAVVEIYNVNDFPTPVLGVITLVDNVSYIIVTHVDLLGARIQGGVNSVLIGLSSENCSLTSTGLTGAPLISSIYSMPIRNLAIKDVEQGFYFDREIGVNVIALDWTGVNFVNCGIGGEIKEVDNFIFDKGIFVECGPIIFSGAIGTIGMGNNLYRGDGSAGNLIEITSTCVISRRFRLVYSSVIAFGSTVAIDVQAGATIPVESFILDTVNFSGGSTYLNGLSSSDNETNISNCKGIENTSEVSQYYMNGNTTATTITATNTPVKVAGTTNSAPVTQKFVNTNNRSTYVGSLVRYFYITGTVSCESGNNNEVGIFIYKNGTQITSSEIYSTMSGNGRGENITVQALVLLSTDDYIEIFTENRTSANDVTVTEMNIITK